MISSGGMTGNSGATGSGGTTGTGGITGTGGATGSGGSGSGSSSDGVLCPPLKSALITDFTYTPIDGATTGTDFVHFDDATSLSGTENLYPVAGSYPLTSDVTKNNWHISGTLGDYSGFGLSIENCNRIDASAYRGIFFTISGSVPQGNQITMGIGTLNNTPAATWLIANGDTSTMPADPGRCIPTAGNQYYHPGCTDATTLIPVTPTPTVQNILWSDFSGGVPEASVNPSGIVAIYWYFPWSSGSTPSAVDIVIDDLSFIP
jgi:hypothetical protein